jgi:alginate O-acetyltransferase complex protein AlgI
MSYTSFEFLGFLAAAVCLYHLCPLRWRPALLLVLSYTFYLTWVPKAALLLAALSVLTFFAARSSGAGGRLTPALIILLVACLAAFKIALLFPARGIAGLVMPLGISYYTFKLISYVLDVHWGKIVPEQSLIRFAAYVSFFPQIVAGPIQRPGDFFSQLPSFRFSLWDALPRIAWGFTKKLLIADNLAPTVNYVYAHVSSLQGAPLLMGFYLYPLQLYADFSGLTDMAIGVGRLFAINGPENFERPFTATTISGYWRRWHMSLTSWFVDYVFTPLRMATRTVGNLGLAFSITVNMVLIGMWHGLARGFVIFGLIHSCYITMEAITARWRNRFFKRHQKWNTAGNLLGCYLTFHLVAFALVFFRSPHVSDAVWLLEHLTTGWAKVNFFPASMQMQVSLRNLAVGLMGYAVLELGERLRPDLLVRNMRGSAPRWMRWSFYFAATVVVAFGLSLLVLHAGQARSQFIYEIF